MLTNIAKTAAPPEALTRLVKTIQQTWRHGTAPDAAGAIREHPELLLHHSLVVDLAYEEYCLLEEVGRAPEPEEFCKGLPAFRSRVREVIDGHRLFNEHPELLAKLDVIWPMPHDRIEGLTIVRELGRGTFARAYLALDPDAGDRPVVLKLSQTPSSEARTLGPMNHPHVVKIHWAKLSQEMHAICMPFVGATTIRDVIDTAFNTAVPKSPSWTILSLIDTVGVPSSQMSPGHEPRLLGGHESYTDSVAAIASRLASALEYIHQMGISHGDLKPSNIVLGVGGHPYLIDFNLSTKREDALLRCGGTLPYMAPEQLRLLLGESGDASPTSRSDIYSFGVVLFELLTGNLPYKPIATADLKQIAIDLLRCQTSGVPGISRANPSVPWSLARMVESCLAADALQRPTAQALQKALRHYLQRRPRRKQWLIALLAVVVAAVGAAQLRPEPKTDTASAPQPSEVPTKPRPSTADELFDRGVEFLKTGDTVLAMKDFLDAHRIKPDGRNTAFLALCYSRNGKQLAAVGLYQEAIEVHHYETAWVHNNLSFGLIEPGSPRKLRSAIEEATTALLLDPNLRAARINRMFARFLLTLDPKTQTLQDPKDCLLDLEAVMATGPYNADLYYKAAIILAASKRGSEDRASSAVHYLHEAVLLGKKFNSINQNPVVLAHLANRSDFKKLADVPSLDPTEPSSNYHIVTPSIP
jgi:eukaryotic-like serine/threonine-protein kinase